MCVKPTRQNICVLLLAVGICVAVVATIMHGRDSPVVETPLCPVPWRRSMLDVTPTADGFHIVQYPHAGKVIVDGKVISGPEAPGDIAVGTVLFSPNSQRLAYEASTDSIAGTQSKQFVVLDGQAGSEHDQVEWILFSPDSQHLAYMAKDGDKSAVVVDGRAGPAYENVRNLRFSPDGKHLAYAAKAGGKWGIVLDGQPGQNDAEIDPWSLVFGPDGQFAYAAYKDGKSSVVVNGEPGPPYDEVDPDSMVFGPHGQFAYAAQKDGKWFAVVDGQAGLPCDAIRRGSMLFSPDGRLAYAAKENAKWFPVVDGQPGPEHEDVYGITFSPDGTRMVYAAKKGLKWSAVLDGQEDSTHNVAGWFIFSPDSRRLVYVTMEEHREVVIDGQGWWPFSVVTYPSYRVVVDGCPGPRYDFLDCGPVFREDGTVEYVASRDETVYRVTVRPPVPRTE